MSGYKAPMKYDHYSDGYHVGTDWANADRRDHRPAADELAMMREEAQSSQRWARAFYLGAMRGYRSVARTLKAGRWGL